MKINCSCRGFNENCLTCFGRGYYDDQDIGSSLQQFKGVKITIESKFSVAKKSAPQKPISKKPVTKQVVRLNVIECPNCKSKILRTEYEKHITKCRIKFYVREVIECPYCKSKVLKTEYEKHIIKCKFKFYVREVIECPNCSAKVRNHRLAQHMKKVHNIPLTDYDKGLIAAGQNAGNAIKKAPRRVVLNNANYSRVFINRTTHENVTLKKKKSIKCLVDSASPKIDLKNKIIQSTRIEVSSEISSHKLKHKDEDSMELLILDDEFDTTQILLTE